MTHPCVYSRRLGPLRRTCAKSWDWLQRCQCQISVGTFGSIIAEFFTNIWRSTNSSNTRWDVCLTTMTKVSKHLCVCMYVSYLTTCMSYRCRWRVRYSKTRLFHQQTKPKVLSCCDLFIVFRHGRCRGRGRPGNGGWENWWRRE